MWPFDAPIYPDRLICFECEKEPFSRTYQFESSAEHNYRYTVHNYTLLPVYHFTPVDVTTHIATGTDARITFYRSYVTMCE